MPSTFNGDPSLKAQILNAAQVFAAKVGSRDRKRESLHFTRRAWCPGQFVCQKGEQCDHRFYADEVGVPVAIAYSEHALFLELPERQARRWWSRYLKSIPVGVDLAESGVWKKFALYVLADRNYGLLTYAHDREQYDAIRDIIKLYQSDCQDAEAWEAAAQAARVAYQKSPYRNNRMNGDDALIEAGCKACYAACYFARAFADPRYASEAVAWSGWSARYKRYSQHMLEMHDPHDDVRADARGMVNVGAALWASSQWVQISEDGDHLGEIERAAHNIRLADRLVQLIGDAEPRSFAMRALRSIGKAVRIV